MGSNRRNDTAWLYTLAAILLSVGMLVLLLAERRLNITEQQSMKPSAGQMRYSGKRSADISDLATLGVIILLLLSLPVVFFMAAQAEIYQFIEIGFETLFFGKEGATEDPHPDSYPVSLTIALVFGLGWAFRKALFAGSAEKEILARLVLGPGFAALLVAVFAYTFYLVQRGIFTPESIELINALGITPGDILKQIAVLTVSSLTIRMLESHFESIFNW